MSDPTLSQQETTHAQLSESVSVIIPAYNEMEQIESVIREVDRVLHQACARYNIIVVNDHSIDRTGEILSTLSQAIPHLVITENASGKGKGSAIMHGCSLATGELLVFLDADLDLPPAQLSNFFSLYQKSHPDGIIGSKYHPLSVVNFPQKRKILSKGYQLFSHMLFKLPYQDTQTGMKLFRREAIMTVLPHVHAGKYSYDLELLLLVHRKQYRILETPVIAQFSRPKSRIGLWPILQTFFETWGIWLRTFINTKEPLNNNSFA